MSIFDPAKRDVLWALIHVSAAVVLTLAAITIAINVWSRWSAASAVSRVVRARFSVDPGLLRDALAEARIAAPGVAATELASADLAKPADLERLRALLPRLEPNERPAIHTALALGQVLAGAKPLTIDSSVGEGDAVLITAAGNHTGVLPAPVAASPPYLTTLQVCLPRILADAWARGDAMQVRACVGALIMTFPSHPEHASLTVLAAGLDPAVPDARASIYIRDLADPVQRNRAVTGLAALAPARMTMLAPYAAAGSPLAKRLAGPDGDLEQEVANVASLPGNDARMALITRCAERGRGDLAARVFDMLTDQLKAVMQPTLWAVAGNLGELSGTSPDQTAAISAGSVAGGALTVHLGNRARVIPSGAVTATVDGKPATCTRIGSLLRIPALPGLPVVIKVGAIEAGTITLAAPEKP